MSITIYKSMESGTTQSLFEYSFQVGKLELNVAGVLAAFLTLLLVWLLSRLMQAYIWALDNALRQHGIGVPFPTTDLNIRSLFGLEGRDALRAMRGQAPAVGVEAAAPTAPASRAANDALEDVESGIEESRSKGTSRAVSGQARPLP